MSFRIRKHEAGVEPYDIKVYEGSRWIKRFAWLDKNKKPIDNTGYGALFVIKRRFGVSNDQALVELDEISGITLGGSNGVFEIVVPTADTENWQVERAVWELKTYSDPTSPTDDARRLCYGKVAYFKDIANV